MLKYSLLAAPLCALLAACAANPTPPPAAHQSETGVRSDAGAACPDAELPAGVPAQRMRALLTALASDDSAVQRRYIEDHLAARVRRTVPIERKLAELARLRTDIGGARLCRVEFHTPHEIGVLVARDGKDGTKHSDIKRLSMVLEDEAPHGVFFTRVTPAAAADVSEPLPTLDADARRAVVEALAGKLDGYIFADVAENMKREIRARLAAGAYHDAIHPQALTSWLSADLRRVSKDKHLRVRYSHEPLPADMDQRKEPSPEEIADLRARAEKKNYGFAAVDILDGNVGYIDLRAFWPTEIAGEAADRALAKVADTRALIFDLRRNGGGSPGLIAHITSYLFGDKPVHLNDLYFRVDDKREEFWTKKEVAGRRFGPDKPIYVLTSGYTFSGGEEFSYNLKTQKRATLIGETTGGGAHPVRGYRVTEHIMLVLPVGRAINAVTGDNWEGTGVKPDIEMPAAQALDKALELIGAQG